MTLPPILKNSLFLLCAVFFLALFLRLYNLHILPLHLHQDEIMNGYVGRFILQNGIDLYGHRLPLLYFDNFGDYPNVIPMYISGFFTFVFGVNEFAVRFPVAVLGALTVFPVYYLSLVVSKDKKVSLLCALMLAVLPWHIVLSRATAEIVMGSFFFLVGLSFLVHGITKQKVSSLLLSVPFFFTSYFLYAAFRVITPLMLLAIPFLTANKRIRNTCIIMTVLFFILTAWIGRTHWGGARFKQTSVFHFNNESNGKAERYSYTTNADDLFAIRLFNNKGVIYAREIVKQYLSYFSPTYLFSTGGHPDRYLVPDQGLLYISFLVLAVLVIAVHVFFREFLESNKTFHYDKKLYLFMFYIMLLAPLSSALTLDEVPNVHRSGFLGVMLVLLLSFCFLTLRSLRIRKVPLVLVFLIMITGEFAFFWHQYRVHGPLAQTVSRYDERTVLTKYLIANQSTYKEIFVPREIFPIYYVFYSQNFDPKLAGQFNKNLYIPQIDNIHFVDTNCPSNIADLPVTKDSLIVDLSSCKIFDGFVPQTSVLRLGGTQAYRLSYVFGSTLPQLSGVIKD